LERNRQRDAENLAALNGLGWDVLVVWECETQDLARLGERITEFLEPS
jgi:DNA mismatch endonuclease (patch repair protein)